MTPSDAINALKTVSLSRGKLADTSDSFFKSVQASPPAQPAFDVVLQLEALHNALDVLRPPGLKIDAEAALRPPEIRLELRHVFLAALESLIVMAPLLFADSVSFDSEAVSEDFDLRLKLGKVFRVPGFDKIPGKLDFQV